MSTLFFSFDRKFKVKANVDSSTPEWGTNHIQTGLLFSFSETCDYSEVIYDSIICHLGLHDLYTAIKIQQNGPKELKTDNKASVVREKP